MEKEECPVCFNIFDNMMKWEECPHTVCKDCFIKSSVVYSFENNSIKIECPLCRTDINHITVGSEQLTVDLWTKLFRTVRRKRCIKCGEKNAPVPVVKHIDSCKIHEEMCLDCGVRVECIPPGCFFLKCMVCETEEKTPNFVGCFYCGNCPGHVKENPTRQIEIHNEYHRKLLSVCGKCFMYRVACKQHWVVPEKMPICECKLDS